ncbi:diiron oxygenase [Corynebacteriales bacterium D3-21]|uniref:Diiron oxygenase n=2 Tax=Speluncibacter jeojiensis TaxID=2710754 RepID=A0A9X4LV19_9ACTN|nr:diiron oxygenase [Rhodococcus sp. D2-41]MDG3012939.1 diiron oxygenase [Corynebacteriales bacterium D3-21]
METPATQSGEEYEEMLTRLSDGSIHRSFDPYRDIDWDAPEFQVVPDDTRWILPEIDPLGAHPWYKALPREKQIAVGMYRQANVAKVGLGFEQVLIRGFMQYVSMLPNGSAEFRYATHEVKEECNHTLMFQEMVNRTGVDVPGFGPVMRRVAPFLGLAAWPFPSIFFMGVLAGEEPIDHIQKNYLRTDGDFHPTLKGVMRIHVAEEARHISFAHEFLRQHVPANGRFAKYILSLAFPIIMRILCDVIVIPPKEFFKEFDIPKQVKKDLFWDAPASRRELSGYFGDVRMLGEELGLMNRSSKKLWKLLKIDGRPSRFRSEPEREPLAPAA